MDRHFILPVSVALALHAGVLFGFRKGERPHLPVTRDKPPIPSIALRPVEEPVPPLPSDDAQPTESSAPSSSAPVPELPEPVPFSTQSDFRFTPPERPPVAPGAIETIIPIGRPGLDGGLGQNGPGGIVPSTVLDATPRARLQPSPNYPPPARQSGLSGQVEVEFVVDLSGRVASVRVLRATDQVFVEPTLRAVERWRFEPGKRGGRTVSFRMAVPVVFNLNGD